MRRQIEGDAQTFLTGCQVATVKGIRVLGGREAGVLPHGPRLLDVHGGIGTAQERRETGHGVEMIDALQISGCVKRPHGNVLWSLPREALAGFVGSHLPVAEAGLDRAATIQGHVGEVRNLGPAFSSHSTPVLLPLAAVRVTSPTHRT